MKVVDYDQVTRAIAAECKRQMVGPKEVRQLHDAYHFARRMTQEGGINTVSIAYLARLIEPVKGNGYRTQPAYFANMNHAVEPHLISRALVRLVDSQSRLTTDEFVKEFLDIHPFADGNGRVAFLLYNVLNNTLHYPGTLPDYYG